MASAAERALRKAITSRVFEPVYYFHGDDDFLKEETVREVVDAAADPSTRDFNLEYRRGTELTSDALDSLLGTPPMMADRRVAVIRDPGALRKDVRPVLDRYLARPAADLVLLLVAPAGAKPDRALAEKSVAVEFSPLSGDRVPRWIMHHGRSVLGLEVSPESAALLQSAIGDDLPALASELDKLASYVSMKGTPGVIDEAAIADVVGVRRGETLGDFLDRVAERDASRALGLVPHVLSQPKTTGVSLVLALATQMLALSWARARLDEGASRGRLQGEIFDLLRGAGSVFTGRPWGEAAAAWSRTAELWTAAELDEAVERVLEADIALKEVRFSSEEQVIASLVLEICAAGQRRAAVA